MLSLGIRWPQAALLVLLTLSNYYALLYIVHSLNPDSPLGTGVAPLKSPTSEPICPGNRIIFICQQTDLVARWTIKLSSINLERSVNSNERSTLTFENDPGFHFEIHNIITVSNNSNSITTELHVTAVRELDGVTVECSGASGSIEFTIEVASIGKVISMVLMCIHSLNVLHLCKRPSSCSNWNCNFWAIYKNWSLHKRYMVYE